MSQHQPLCSPSCCWNCWWPPTCFLGIMRPALPGTPIKSGHIMPNFHHNLMGIRNCVTTNGASSSKKHMSPSFPKTTLPSSKDGYNPLVPSSGGSLFVPNTILTLQIHGALPPWLSMITTSPASEHLSDTSILRLTSRKVHLACCHTYW